MKGSNEHIPIHNIYYMLTYAFQAFNFTSIEDKVGKESFDNIYDLFAELLQMGIAFQLKRGLHREYVPLSESITTMKGRIDIKNTIINRINRRQLLHCEHDEWSENNLHNQILKATLLLLLQKTDVETQRKNKLKKLLPFFSNVSNIPVSHINQKHVHYKKNSGLYPMLHFICSLVIEHNLLSTINAKHVDSIYWSDERMMSVLYEKFLLGYFKKHHSKLLPKAEEISWTIDRYNTSNDILPKMQSDIVLHGSTRTLIIDAKYYGKTLTENYNKRSIHSSNLYQISSYVMNMDKGHWGNVDGMLLYAQTNDESMILNNKMTYLDGNIIYFKTLDLNQDFSQIRLQLDSIAELLHCN